MKKGYSFIELILVVGALALIATFSVSRYNDFNQRQIVGQTADSFISNLRLVQAKALSGEKPTGCTSLVGWTVAFSVKSYDTYAECSPEGVIANSRVTVNLPGNVNLSYSSGTVIYYSLGHGTSGNQTVNIVGTATTIPVVLSASSITKGVPTATTIVVVTPTPTTVSCPWPVGDPRCS